MPNLQLQNTQERDGQDKGFLSMLICVEQSNIMLCRRQNLFMRNRDGESLMYLPHSHTTFSAHLTLGMNFMLKSREPPQMEHRSYSLLMKSSMPRITIPTSHFSSYHTSK